MVGPQNRVEDSCCLTMICSRGSLRHGTSDRQSQNLPHSLSHRGNSSRGLACWAQGHATSRWQGCSSHLDPRLQARALPAVPQPLLVPPQCIAQGLLCMRSPKTSRMKPRLCTGEPRILLFVFQPLCWVTQEAACFHHLSVEDIYL